MKNNKNLVTNKGIGLVQAMIVLTVLGLGSVTVIRRTKITSLSSRGNAQNSERLTVVNEITDVLSSESTCTRTFRNLDPNNETEIVDGIKVTTNLEPYTTGAIGIVFGKGLLKLKKIIYGGSYPYYDIEGDIENGDPFEQIYASPKRGITGVKLVFERLGEAAGGKEITEGIRLFTTLNASNTVQSCHAISYGRSEYWEPAPDGSTSFNTLGGIWFDKINNTDDRVGIGTATPQDKLHVADNMLVRDNIVSKGNITASDGEIRAQGDNGHVYAEETIEGDLFITHSGSSPAARMFSDRIEAKNVITPHIHGVNGGQFDIKNKDGTFPGLLQGSNYKRGNLTNQTITTDGKLNLKNIDAVVRVRADGNINVNLANSSPVRMRTGTNGNGNLDVSGNLSTQSFKVTSSGFNVKVPPDTRDQNTSLMIPGNFNDYHVQFRGDVTVDTIDYYGSLKQGSDRRLKKNIKSLNGSLERIMELKPVQYIRKNTNSKEYGFIAQDLELVFPNLVEPIPSTDNIKGIRYLSLLSIIVDSIQEQNQRLRNNEQQIEQYKNSLENLSDR